MYNDFSKKLLSTRDAARQLGYSHDYISKLCRQGVIKAEQIGRSWFIEPTAFELFKAEQGKRLSEYKAAASERIVSIYTGVNASTAKTSFFAPYCRPLLGTALVVLFVFGSATSVALHGRFTNWPLTYLNDSAIEDTTLLAAVSVSPASDGEMLFDFVADAVGSFFTVAGDAFAFLFGTPIAHAPELPTTPTPAIAVGAQARAGTTTINQYTTYVTQNPIQYLTVQTTGVTREYLSQSLHSLRDDLNENNEDDDSDSSGGGLADISGESIEDLADVAAMTKTFGELLYWNGTEWANIATSSLGITGSGTVTSVQASGGTTGLSFTGGPVTTTGTLTLSGTLAIANGGTGIATAPTYGQLLVGDGLGGYALRATSSLGITGGGSYTFTYPLVNSANVVSLAFGTTTANSWSALQTFTYASSTGFSTIYASSTNLFAFTASTSALTISGTPNALLSTNGSGVVTSTSISTPLTFSGNTLAITQATTGTNGYLSSTDFTTFNNKISSTSLSGASVISYTSGTGVITTTGGTFGAGNYVFPTDLTVTANASTSNLFATNFRANTAAIGGTGTTTFTSTGFVGVGTTSPFANLSVHANNGSTNTTLFAIGSSTASATTTLLSVSNAGVINAGTGTLQSVGGATILNISIPGSSGGNRPVQVYQPSLAGATTVNSIGFGRTVGSGGGGFLSYTYNAGATSRINLGHWDTPNTLVVTQGDLIGVGTTSPYAKLSVDAPAGIDAFAVGSSTGTYLRVTALGTTTVRNFDIIGATATSSSNVGINLTTGCFAVNGTCLSAGGGSGTVGSGTTGQFPYYAANGTTLTATSTIFVSTASNVGIGTASPYGALTVAGTTLGNSTVAGVTLGNQSAYASAEFFNTTGTLMDFSGTSGRDFDFRHIFTAANNTYTIAASTTANQLVLNGSGNIGIGMTSPSYLLHLQQNGNPQVAISATNSGTNSAGIFLENEGQRNWQIWADRATDTFRIGNNSRTATNLTISSVGNVGIGTTTPLSFVNPAAGKLLDLSGTNPLIALHNTSDPLKEVNIYNFTSGLFIDSTGAATPSNNKITFRVNNTASSNVTGIITAMTIASDGNVGIGTTSPAYKLSVAATDSTAADTVTTGSQFAVTETSGSHGIFMRTKSTAGIGGATFPNQIFSAGGNTGLEVYSDANLVFGASNAEKMRITTAGNVGIGTTTPNRKLGIIGDMIIGSSATNAGVLIQTNGSNGNISGINAAGTAYNGLELSTGASASITINTSGNVGIGASPISGVRLAVQGARTYLAANNELYALGLSYNGTRSNASQNVYIGATDSATPDMVFSNISGSEIFRATNLGNVGIGTSTPGAQLGITTGGAEGIHVTVNGGSQQTYLRGYVGTSQITSLYRPAASNDTALSSWGDLVLLPGQNETGNVGIGTTSPYQELSVTGDLAFTSGNFYVNNTLLVLTPTGGAQNVKVGSLVISNVYSDTAPTNGAFILGTTNIGGGMGGRIFNVANATPFIDMRQTNQASTHLISAVIEFTASGGGRAGYVGVNSGAFQINTDDNATDIPITFATVGSERVRIDTSGNVGIGLGGGSNLAKLHVSMADGGLAALIAGTTKGVRFIHNSTGSTIEGVDNTGTGSYQPLSVGGSYVGFNTGATERMRLIASGNFGIGTTSPASLFSVAGDTYITGGVAVGASVTNPGSGNLTLSGSLVANSGAQIAMVNATTYAMCTDDGTTVGSSLAATCTMSSIRFKENVDTLPFGEALRTLSALRVVSFDYKSGKYDPDDGPEAVGLIAEEVALIDRRLVDYGPDGLPASLHFERVTGLTVQAIQELNLNLETLASTTATTTALSQSFADAFFNNVFARVTAWLGDAGNGVDDFIANRIRTTTLCIADEGGETCLTRAELDDLIAGAAASGGNDTPPEGGGGDVPPPDEPPPGGDGEDPPIDPPPADPPTEEPPAEEPPPPAEPPAEEPSPEPPPSDPLATP